MFWQWLKQYLPRSLYGRGAMILLVPVVSIQLLVSVVFIQRHFNRVTEQMTGSIALELGYLLREVDAAADPTAARAVLAQLDAPLGLVVALPGAQVNDARRFDDLTGGRVRRVLYRELPGLEGVDLASMSGRALLGFETRHGPLRVAFDRGRVSASNPHQLLVIMISFGVLMTLISYFFLRNQLRPIARLAHAAEAFGKGENVTYRIAGATEVRSAGRAFLEMRARIERQIETRTRMLSGVSHDLRTPLTRMRLELSMMPESAERNALEKDVEDMERLVEAFLDFARSEAAEDELEATDPARLLVGLVKAAQRAGLPVEQGDIAEAGQVRLRGLAVRRALDNLIANAVRYGSRVRVSLVAGRRDIRFVVEDDGPGIAPDKRAAAQQPFVRLDAARNQNRGSGVGLGLAIANDTARAHGGRLILGKSRDLGGLMAELVVPV